MEKRSQSHKSEKSHLPRAPEEFGSAVLKQVDDLEARERFEDAIELLERALKAAKDKFPVYVRLAELCRSQRRVEQAIDAVRKAVKLRPRDVQAREMLLEMLLELGKFDEAIQASKAVLRISPRSLSARDVLSIAYLQKGMLEKALQVTNELISLDPTAPENHFKKAVLHQQQGDVGSAIHEFSRVLEMQPDEDMARDAQQAIDTLDNYQIRHILMLAVEDYIFRAKLVRDPESAALERGFFLSGGGLSALRQIQFDELPEVWSEWKQRFYH